MLRKDKQTVTYIKNGKEITKTLQWYNTKFVLKGIFTFKNGGYQTAKDIECVHFKNCQLLDLFALKGPVDGDFIFEDCIFSRSEGSFGPDYLLLYGDRIQLINPELENLNSIIINKAKDVNVKYNREPKKKIESLDVIETKKITIENHHAIDGLDVEADDITLENDFIVKRFSIKGEKVSIVGKPDDVITIATRYVPTISADKKLTLKNCKLEDKENAAYIKFSEIDLENFILDTKKLTAVHITDERFTSGRMKNYDLKSMQTFNNADNFFDFLNDSKNEVVSKKQSENNFSYKNSDDVVRGANSLEDTAIIFDAPLGIATDVNKKR